MKQAIITVLTPEDAKHVPAAVDEMRRARCKTLLVFINPSSVMDVEDFTREADKQIQDLEAAKKAASDREDYAGAAGFKAQIEEAKTNRTNLISNGIKNVPQEKLVSTINATADKFIPTGAYVHQHTPPKDVPQAELNGYIGSLLPKYTFLKNASSIISPQDCETDAEFNAQAPNSSTPEPATAVSPAPKVKTAPPPKKAPVAAPADPREARRVELMRYMKMKAEAKKHGISIENRKTADVVEEILAKEGFAAAA